MTDEYALAYPRRVTYNFSQWTADEPIMMIIEGARHYGRLRNPHGHPPYQIELTEIFENGGSRRIAPLMLEIDDLNGLSFLHHHGH